MTATTVVVDAGPLVALLNRREQHHAWVAARLGELPAPLVTCEAALAEAAYLLRETDRGGQALMALIQRGAVLPPDV